MIISLDAAAAPVSLTLLTATKGNASKRLIADAHGRPASDPAHSLWIAEGRVEHVQLSGLAGLQDLLGRITPKQALVHGVPTGSTPGAMLRLVVAEKYTKDPGTIARSLECFSYPSDRCLLMFDYDPDPAAQIQVTSAAALLEHMAALWPAFGEIGYLTTTSTRSAIRAKAAPDDWLTPPHGMHIYFLATGDVARFRELLKIKLWCAGLGFCKLATTNKNTGVAALLERALVDLTVLSPERLDYVAGAQIAKSAPFYQDRPPPELHAGVVINLDALPDAIDEERQDYARRLEAAKETQRPEQREKVRRRITEQAPTISTQEQEQEIIRRLTHAERDELAPEHLLYFPSREITAQDLTTKAGKALDSKRLCDPQEPDYRDGASQAVFHWRSGDWRIVSWAHGIRKTYRLAPAAPPPPPDDDMAYLLERAEHETARPHARNELQADSPAPSAWKGQLLLNQKNIPTENLSNFLLLLEHHPDWHEQLWWDTVRSQPMRGHSPIDEPLLSDIALWFGTTMRMSIRSLRLLETAVRRVCLYHSHDLLQEWLEALPAWDGTERLTEWLTDVASIKRDEYGMEISRLIPVSMVARALDPGCQYRTVVILEGPENSGKSKLVQTLASMEWYIDFGISMENKEAHMLLQGAWVAELAELATLSRTEEAKLKAFLTVTEDVWIPKYSNFPQRTPRRTIFIGTVNPEEEYLKGQTGNTRFLPIQTGEIDCTLLEDMREQLFAEALVYYRKHPDDWWQLSQEGTQQAVIQREARRQSSIYESDLADWLDHRRFNQEPTFIPGETSWSEIAQYYLQIDREKWKDKPLQMQIAQALRALGYTRKKRSFDVMWKKPPAQ